jgi:tetratricopeptide (TPR) repeat protein
LGTEIPGKAVPVYYVIPTWFVVQVLTLKPGTELSDQPPVGNQMFAVTSAAVTARRHWLKSLGVARRLAGRRSTFVRLCVSEQSFVTSGRILYRNTGRLADAGKAYSEALTIRRELAARDPGAYRPDLAGRLNNLGNLYRNTGRLADADKAYSEALTIYRELTSSNPLQYAAKIASLTELLAKLRGKSSAAAS